MIDLIIKMKEELRDSKAGQHELLVSYLKIYLITALRMKLSQVNDENESYEKDTRPIILQKLMTHIEKFYMVNHSPLEYAVMLNITPNALAKIVKGYFNKTISDLITQRIIIEAKRELYLTSRSVKEIAHQLGYSDEYYFSRFFKKHADVSPQT